MKAKRVLSLARHVPAELMQAYVSTLPGPLGFRLREMFWRPRLRSLGKDVRIDAGVQFVGAAHISIADHAWIDRNVLIIASPPAGARATHVRRVADFPLATGEVFIGENVHISPNCVVNGMGGVYIGRDSGLAAGAAVYSFSHHYRSRAPGDKGVQFCFTPRAREDRQSMILGPVFIEECCGVGTNAIILPGSRLKRGTWVGPGVVMAGSYPEQSLVGRLSVPTVTSLAHLCIRE